MATSADYFNLMKTTFEANVRAVLFPRATAHAINAYVAATPTDTPTNYNGLRWGMFRINEQIDRPQQEEIRTQDLLKRTQKLLPLACHAVTEPHVKTISDLREAIINKFVPSRAIVQNSAALTNFVKHLPTDLYCVRLHFFLQDLLDLKELHKSLGLSAKKFKDEIDMMITNFITAATAVGLDNEFFQTGQFDSANNPILLSQAPFEVPEEEVEWKRWAQNHLVKDRKYDHKHWSPVL